MTKTDKHSRGRTHHPRTPLDLDGTWRKGAARPGAAEQKIPKPRGKETVLGTLGISPRAVRAVGALTVAVGAAGVGFNAISNANERAQSAYEQSIIEGPLRIEAGTFIAHAGTRLREEPVTRNSDPSTGEPANVFMTVPEGQTLRVENGVVAQGADGDSYLGFTLDSENAEHGEAYWINMSVLGQYDENGNPYAQLEMSPNQDSALITEIGYDPNQGFVLEDPAHTGMAVATGHLG